MKKIIAVLISILILTAMVSVYAEPVVLSEFDDNDYMSFVIEGQADANTGVLAVIYKPGYTAGNFSVGNERTTVLNIQHTTANEYGLYEIRFNMECEDYAYQTNDYAMSVSYIQDGVRVTDGELKDFKFVSKSDRNSILQMWTGLSTDENNKDTTLESIETILTDHGENMMIDSQLLSIYLNDENVAAYVNEMIFSNLDKMTSIGIIKSFSEEQICMATLNNADENTISDYIDLFKFNLGLDNAVYIDKYPYLKTSIYKRLADGENVLTAAEFDNKILETVGTVYLENSVRWGDLNTRLVEYNDYIHANISNGSDYSKVKDKSQIFVTMLSKKPYKGFSDILTKFNNAVTACLKAESSQNNSGSTGGGTGGGSGGSSGGGGNIGFGGGFSWSAQEIPVTTPEVIVPSADTTSVFPDMENNHWAYDAMYNLKTKGVMAGDDKGNINPDSNVTRVELLKMIIEAMKFEKTTEAITLLDCKPDDWYYNYVATGYKLGIVNGVSEDKFGSQMTVSRQDMAVMLHRALKMSGYNFELQSEVKFNDEGEISDYATESVKSLAAAKLINGFPDGSFRTNNLLTRAEAATIIWRVIKQ